MLNRLAAFSREYGLLAPGDRVYCAVSGGADSMALLWAMYLLREKLGITLAAAHFNHRLRGEESDRDAQFVSDFCRAYGIALTMGEGSIRPEGKGLEAAARNARYVFLEQLPGKVATAHTADDNAETVLLHLIRGTGLQGLGGIPPCRGRLIRPMLTVTREQVMDFLAQYHIPHIEDSTNAEDTFLRNRLRHGVMPLLKAENPRLAENLSAMALGLREDAAALQALTPSPQSCGVAALREMPAALRRRALGRLLRESGVKEPEKNHIYLAESLVFSEKPSARAEFPGGVVLQRSYGQLRAAPSETPVCSERTLCCPGEIRWEAPAFSMELSRADKPRREKMDFTVAPEGRLLLRGRRAGDTICLPGGRKSLKKLFIDRKIPANLRPSIPVLSDERGVIWVWGIGPSADRIGQPDGAVRIQITYPPAEC